MPIFDYYCENCGAENKNELVKSADVEVICVVCGENMKHIMGACQFKFKSHALQKHLKKYGNNTDEGQGVPNGKDNGVRFIPSN